MEMVQAAELLRHPHLQPYLAQYSNLSPVFLPVRSEMESTKSRIGQKKQISDATTPQVEKNTKGTKLEQVEVEVETTSSTKGRRESINSLSESSTVSEEGAERSGECMKEEKQNLEKMGSAGDEKAEAMESLLELCAQLLKRERFEELAGVLKPFGEEEVVSSRETAIWLTKGLMNIQRKNQEAA